MNDYKDHDVQKHGEGDFHTNRDKNKNHAQNSHNKYMVANYSKWVKQVHFEADKDPLFLLLKKKFIKIFEFLNFLFFIPNKNDARKSK